MSAFSTVWPRFSIARPSWFYEQLLPFMQGKVESDKADKVGAAVQNAMLHLHDRLRQAGTTWTPSTAGTYDDKSRMTAHAMAHAIAAYRPSLTPAQLRCIVGTFVAIAYSETRVGKMKVECDQLLDDGGYYITKARSDAATVKRRKAYTSKYNGMSSIGNKWWDPSLKSYEGDSDRYCGRWFFQLTGRGNFRLVSRLIFERDPWVLDEVNLILKTFGAPTLERRDAEWLLSLSTWQLDILSQDMALGLIIAMHFYFRDASFFDKLPADETQMGRAIVGNCVKYHGYQKTSPNRPLVLSKAYVLGIMP